MKWLKIILLTILIGAISVVAFAITPQKTNEHVGNRVLKMQTITGTQDVVIANDGSVSSNNEIFAATASSALKKIDKRYERNTFSIKPTNSRFAKLNSKNVTKENVADFCIEFLKENQDRTGIDVNNIALYNVVPSRNSFVVVFNQKYNGVDVRDSYVRMYINAKGEIKTFASKYFDDIELTDVNIPATHQTIKAAAFGLNDNYNNYKFELKHGNVILPVFNGTSYDYRLVREIEVIKPGEELYVAYVDANNGELIKRINLNSNLNLKVTAKLFDNPNEALVTTDIPYTIFNIDGNEYTTNALGMLNNLPDNVVGKEYTTNLNGNYAKMHARSYPNNVTTEYSKTGTITADGIFMNDSNNYDEVMRTIYNSINVVRNYYANIESSPEVMNKLSKLNIYAQILNEDDINNMNLEFNAFASGDMSITLLCANHNYVHLGKLNKVTYHEYGHSVVRAKYTTVSGNPYIGMKNSTGNEACADITSAFITNNPRAFDGVVDPDKEVDGIKLGEWAKTHNLFRTCENDYTYPENVRGEGHDDSEILSGAFWDFKQAFGDDEDKLYEVYYTVHNAKNYLPDGNTLQEVYSSWFDALVRANDDYIEGDGEYTYNFTEIYNAFEKHKIGLNLLIQDRFEHTNVADEADITKPIPVVATLNEIATPEEIDFTLNYYTSEDSEVKTLPMTRTDGTDGWEYKADIPAQTVAGTVIHYYFTYLDPFANQTHKIDNDYFTLSGFKELVNDNCEDENVGKFSAQNSQNATYGFRIKVPPTVAVQNVRPVGCYLFSPGFTTSGNKCWSTNITQSYNAKGDEITTSLKDTSMIVSSTMNFANESDESALFLTYNLYYILRAGGASGLIVQVSFDNGNNWKTVDSIKGIQLPKNWDWTRRYVTLGVKSENDFSNVKVRFVSYSNNNTVGFATLIDDIKIFSTPNPNNINEDKFAMDVVVSPNPANESINLSLPTSLNNVEVNIIDAMGKIVATYNYSGEITNQNINISNLNNGTYFVSVKSNSTRLLGRFVISKN